MPSSKEYLDYVLDQLSLVDGITFRAMMGEYIIYCRGKIVGGIYDDRLLVKPVKSALEKLPDAPLEIPYDGAKKMILIEEIDDREFLAELIESIFEELPLPKNNRKS
ncbi:MAG: TfoX/Sxy family protein [Spirochaetaceae bacterium]|nr:TfoX/Sxy family protein [Spirochaetaceae bacterium]